jgi:hypothetical protein
LEKTLTDETQHPLILSMRQEDLDELLTRAAERGAERCLAHLGLTRTTSREVGAQGPDATPLAGEGTATIP